MKIKNIIIIICIFAVCLPLFACAAQDPYKKSVVLKTENFSLTRGELAYFFVRTMQSSLDSYSDIELKEMGYDKSKSPSEQTFKEGKTWFDVFFAGALSHANEILALCEAAREAGFNIDNRKLTDKIEDFKARCEEEYSVTFEKYIDITYFGYTDEQDYAHALELEYLAGAYMETVSERICSEISDPRIEEYIEANIQSPNNERTKNVMIIVLSEGGRAKAEEILALRPQKSFEELAREYSASETFLYENCRRYELYGAEGDWVFADGRVAGETGIVENTDGTVSIVYYVGEGRTISETEAIFALAKSDYSDYLDTLFERFPIISDKDAIKSLVI